MDVLSENQIVNYVRFQQVVSLYLITLVLIRFADSLNGLG